MLSTFTFEWFLVLFAILALATVAGITIIKLMKISDSEELTTDKTAIRKE